MPKSARPRYQCNIPGCDAKFAETERVAWEQHVARCTREHHDELVEQYKTARPDAFFKPFDPEYAAWAKKNRRIA